MTEEEWLAELDPDRMLQQFEESPPWRKLHLLSCTFLRSIWDLIPEGTLQRAVDLAEQFADECAYTKEFEETTVWLDNAIVVFWLGPVHPKTRVDYYATHAVFGFFRWVWHESIVLGIARDSRKARGRITWSAVATEDDSGTFPKAKEAMDITEREEAIRQCELVLEVFGNPFQATTIRSGWLTRDVLAQSHAAYDERIMPSGHLHPTRLAVISDALEDAGCTDTAILTHLRSPGPHVRGCWALDLLLGKS